MIGGRRGKNGKSGGWFDGTGGKAGREPVGSSGGCAFLPDLSLWYDWYASRGTLPEGLGEKSLSGVAAGLGVRGWIPSVPWRAEFPGLEVSLDRGESEIVRTVRTSKDTLTSRWILGPDGDWWQSEYPVKTADDLDAAYEYCRAKIYSPPEDLSRAAADADPGSDILALRLPQQPFSEILHDLLGFDEGIIILMQEGERIEELVGLLESSYADLLDSLVPRIDEIDPEGPGDTGEIVFYSPDNLDSNFISPNLFDRYLRDGYIRTLERLHGAEYGLAVHIGGYIRPLLSRLGEIGVDILQGISGPPQSDADLSEARELAGQGPLLWGGIPQDLLLPTAERSELEETLDEVARSCAADGRMVAGISDKVPVEADLEKFEIVRNFFKNRT
jgi:hypothetical protein